MKKLAYILLVPLTSLACSSALFTNVFVTPKLITLTAGIIIAIFSTQYHILPKGYKGALAFLIATTICGVFGLDQTAALYGQFRCPYYGLYALVLVFMAYCTAQSDEAGTICELVAMSAAAQGAIATFQAILQTSGIESVHLAFGGRVSGTIGSPVFLGIYLVIGVICCFVVEDERLAGVCVGMCTTGLIAAKSLAAIPCLIVAVSVMLSQKHRKAQVIAVVSALLMGWVATSHAPNCLERVELLKISWAAFLKHPWFGYGPDNFIMAFRQNRTLEYIHILGKSEMGQASAHNWFGQVLATQGLFGLAFFILAMRSVWEGVKEDSIGSAVFAAVFVYGLVQPVPIETQVVVAIIIGSRSYKSDDMYGLVFPTGILIATSVGLLLMLRSFVVPDYYSRKGLYGSAAFASPFVDHASTYLNESLKLPLTPSQLVEVTKVAEKTLTWHPHDAVALDDAATVRYVFSRRKMLQRSLYTAYMAEGQAIMMDPTLAYLRFRHYALAVEVGDRSGAAYSLAMFKKIKQAEAH